MVDLKLCFLVTVSCTILNLCYGGQPNVGPVGPIDITYIKICNDKPDKPLTAAEIDFHGTDNGNSVDLKLVTTKPIDHTYTFKLSSDKWEDGVWKEGNMVVQGTLYSFINQNFKKCWDNIRKELKILTPFEIPPGEYVTKNYQETYKNIEIPQMLYGKFRSRLWIYDGANKSVVCVDSEAETLPP